MNSVLNIPAIDYVRDSDTWRQLVLINFRANQSPQFLRQETAYTHYLERLVRYTQSLSTYYPDLNGKVIATIHDAVWSKEDDYPILCFGRPVGEKSCGLIPDPFYIGSDGFLEDIASINQLYVPWEKRRETAYFRGTSTGGQLTFANWKQNRRVKLSLISLDQPELLDSRITTIAQEEEPGVGEELKLAGIVSEFEPPETALSYRYLIEIDGNANSWGFFFKLATGAAVFKVESIWEQWFYEWLKPWVHYIPVRKDLNDLIDKIKWAKENDSEAQKIGQNGRELVLSLKFDRALKHSAEVVGDLIKRTKQE